jgi:AMP-polyphosphate phosphotransferase
MKAKNFVVSKRPALAKITKHPAVRLADYERRLQSMQSVMQSIQQAYLATGQRAVIVLEGWDTAGKGGVVRRLGWALDPRSFKVYPIAAPSSHERGRHYLQRFWEKLPDPGQIVVFDRSWYGRVLVERVEGLASKREWHRSYDEINEFERMMVADGIRIVKCFLHITPAEQIRRFKDRVTNPLKRWKLSYEDFRNRSRWADYEVAIEDMMEKTSRTLAPWYLIPANDKPYGRLAVFTILIEVLGKGQSLKPRPLDPKVAEMAKQLLDLA